MKLKTPAEWKFHMKKIYLLFTMAILLAIPTPVLAAESGKWYMKPFEWMIGKFFEYFLTPFIGIREPAYYIFYSGDGLIWGLYTQDQFNNAIKTGFNMMLFVVSFMLVTAIIKMGIQNAYGKFSASMKVDLMDNGLKVLLALLLLFQFFTIVNTFATINVYGVTLFDKAISDRTSLVDIGAEILTSADGEKKPGDEITFTDLDNGSKNPIKNAIVSFFSLGVAVWFKAYYIQRLFVISGLIVLAPIWISTMFFPKLQGITATAFKELWAQMMSQTIHAATFFLYFYLFDASQDWFTYIIGLAIFIPVSESLRFAMGATSDNAGRLAQIGTLAGAGSLMHMMKAGSEIKNGFKNAFMERKGQFDGPTGASNGGSSSTIHGVGFGKENADRQYGGTANLNASPNRFARNMRSFGHIAAGMGSAIMRTGGYSAGMGINPLAGHLAAEGGAQVGKQAGYGAGVLAYTGGKGVQSTGRDAMEGFKENFASTRESGGNVLQATTSGIGGGFKKGIPILRTKDDPFRRNEHLQKVGGAFGDASYGRGVGYHMGAEAATRFVGQGMPDPQITELSEKKDYAVVTSNQGSYLAQRGPNNKLTPISNTKAGDVNLQNGQMVIQDYKISTDQAGVKSFQPVNSQYSIKQVQDRADSTKFVKQMVATPAKQPNIQEFLNQKPYTPPKPLK